jgi:hypothetical protein
MRKVVHRVLHRETGLQIGEVPSFAWAQDIVASRSVAESCSRREFRILSMLEEDAPRILDAGELPW